MIAIENTLVSDEVIDQQFVCNLNACKGVCCIKGDGGAPLEDEELGYLDDLYDRIEPYLDEVGKQEIAKQGRYTVETETGKFVTPLVDGGPCVYVTYENGVTKCGIERAWEDGKIDFRKPVSCHLYPIRIKQLDEYEAVNYEKWQICEAACTLGEELKVPVYKFVKEALIRKYGEDWYATLEATVEHLNK